MSCSTFQDLYSFWHMLCNLQPVYKPGMLAEDVTLVFLHPTIVHVTHAVSFVAKSCTCLPKPWLPIHGTDSNIVCCSALPSRHDSC